jgi:hypothetical protein
MDRSFSRQSIKPKKLGIRHKLAVWLKARADGPRHKRGPLPLGTLEPAIVQIQQWVYKRNQRLAALCSHYRHSIPAAMNQAAVALSRPKAELAKRQRALDDVTERYKADHDAMEPPEHSAPFTQITSFVVLGIIFAIGEVPLMSAALERLPLPDWTRFVAALCASAVVIYMSHEIGIWFAKPAKTLAQTVFGWILVAVLCTILTFAAMVRRDAIRDRQQSPSRTAPEVHFLQPSETQERHV